MGRADWEAYKREVLVATNRAAGPIVFEAESDGWDTLADAPAEQSFTVIGAAEVTNDDGATLDRFVLELWKAARAYRQEAIAVTIGETRFTGPLASRWGRAL